MEIKCFGTVVILAVLICIYSILPLGIKNVFNKDILYLYRLINNRAELLLLTLAVFPLSEAMKSGSAIVNDKRSKLAIKSQISGISAVAIGKTLLFLFVAMCSRQMTDYTQQKYNFLVWGDIANQYGGLITYVMICAFDCIKMWFFCTFSYSLNIYAKKNSATIVTPIVAYYSFVAFSEKMPDYLKYYLIHAGTCFPDNPVLSICFSCFIFIVASFLLTLVNRFARCERIGHEQ